MIRVLHSVSNMDRAGIETMLMNYYRNIDRSQIQFDFLCNKKKIGAYEEEIKKLGGIIYRTPGLNPFKFFQYKKYMKQLFLNHPEYKIIHAHNGAFALYSLYCAKKNKIPIKIFCKSKLKKNITNKWACGNQAVKFYYGNDVFKNGDYTIIHNAINLNKFIYNIEIRNKIRNNYNFKNDNIVIGHVGRFSPIKNHPFLIKIFSNLLLKNEKYRLVLIGDGEDENKIKKMVDNLKLQDKVLFLGNIENEWYQAFDLFILPSINEGLPVVGIEAQASGLPCVFSKTVPQEIDVTGNCTFIDLNDNVNIWIDNIEKVVSTFKRKDTSHLLSKNGYDISQETKKLEKLYLDLYKENSI